MNHVLDAEFSRVTRSDMYRAWVFPEEYPGEQQPRLSNWSDEDLVAFCGIYDRKEIAKHGDV